jgi:uncharacterized membrane protein YqjE
MALGRSLTGVGTGSPQVARQWRQAASLDVEEEILRIGGLLAGALVTALMLALAAAGAAAAFAVHFWGDSRLPATVSAATFFTMAAALTAWRVACALRDKPCLPAGTPTEVDSDFYR